MKGFARFVVLYRCRSKDPRDLCCQNRGSVVKDTGGINSNLIELLL